MEKIQQITLDTMLESYKPEFRYLVKAKFQYPYAEGIFKIPKTAYGIEGKDTGHFTLIELGFCYNQLAYTFFAEAFEKGLIKEVEKSSLKKTKEYQLHSSFIIVLDNVKFWKQINPKKFQGQIKLEKIIQKRKDLIFFKTSYDFENGKATGEINLAFLKK